MVDEHRTAVVTGTTGGIGTEIGRELARQGFTVGMHGRDRARTEAVVEDVRRSTGNDRVHALVGDLGKREEVRALADVIAERFPSLNALIHNAAVVPHDRVVTDEGLEQAFAVNVLAPHRLNTWLRPNLAAGSARVVGFWGGGSDVLAVDDLQSERGAFDGWTCYCQTKNAVAALTLATAAAEDGPVQWFVTVPGLVNTPGMRNLPGRMIWFSRLLWWAMRSPAEGARTPVWLATAPELAGKP
ncbi:MAG: SDR family NAD(P)-dependent oxidoreductase, partial [Myxococcales bacterium]|nr:SDR family NAD(P)-dependent oxidoreductase [Myxococcales bacterium]